LEGWGVIEGRGGSHGGSVFIHRSGNNSYQWLLLGQVTHSASKVVKCPVFILIKEHHCGLCDMFATKHIKYIDIRDSFSSRLAEKMEIPVEKEVLFVPKEQEKVEEECNWCNPQAYTYKNHAMSRCQRLYKKEQRGKRRKKPLHAIYIPVKQDDRSHNRSMLAPYSH